MKTMLLLGFFGVTLLTSGCASIVSESSYPVTINSAPDGAKFVIENERGTKVHTGLTPSTVSLKSGDGYFSSVAYKVTFSKNGFEDKTVFIESTMDGWYIGNILFGGLVGFLIVDPITGAMWKLPESQSVSLEQKVPLITEKTSLEIVSTEVDSEVSEDTNVKIN